jgi:predicted chitinase
MKYQNEMIEKYEALQAEAKRIEKELNEMKSQFIASNGGESENHLIVIKDNFRESVASKAEFEKRFGADWLKDNGLLKLSAFNTVVIQRKIARAVS